VPDVCRAYPIEIKIFFLLQPVKRGRATLQIVKIAGREQDGILEDWNDGVLGVGYWILGAR